MLSKNQIVILGASLLIVGCTSSEVPAPAMQQSNSSAMESNVAETISSTNNTSIFSIENVTQPIIISGKSYNQLVSQKLVRTDPHTGLKEVVVDSLEKDLGGSSKCTQEFRIVTESITQPDRLYFLVKVCGPDTASYNFLKYNAATRSAEHSPLGDLFRSKNGDYLRIALSARYIWAPFIDGGINTEDRVIFLVDFETETSSVIVSLPETETLNGADHCDHFNFITDITVTNSMLKYAVYSQTKLDELYVDACSGKGDKELQAKNAQKAFLEYRTLDIMTDRNSSLHYDVCLATYCAA